MTHDELEAKVELLETELLDANKQLSHAAEILKRNNLIADQIRRDMIKLRNALADCQGKEAGPTAKRLSHLLQHLTEKGVITSAAQHNILTPPRPPPAADVSPTL